MKQIDLPEPLTLDEEQELACVVQNASLPVEKRIEARNKLVSHNLRWVIWRINAYRDGMDQDAFEDFKSTILSELPRYAEFFEPQGVRFVGYLESFLTGMMNQLRGEIGASARMRVDGEYPVRLNWTASASRCVPNEEARPFRKWEEQIADDEQSSPEDEFLAKEQKALVTDAVEKLDSRRALIVRLYYGLDGQETVGRRNPVGGLSLDMIGSMLGIQGESVRRLRDTALDSVRRQLSRRGWRKLRTISTER